MFQHSKTVSDELRVVEIAVEKLLREFLEHGFTNVEGVLAMGEISNGPVRDGGKILMKLECADALEKDGLGSLAAVPRRKHRFLIVLL